MIIKNRLRNINIINNMNHNINKMIIDININKRIISNNTNNLIRNIMNKVM